jgi:hypothetical protein
MEMPARNLQDLFRGSSALRFLIDRLVSSPIDAMHTQPGIPFSIMDWHSFSSGSRHA